MAGDNGNPIVGLKRPGERMTDALARLGINVDGKRGIVIPPDALAKIRAERARDVTVTSVPSTQRMIQREAGGVGYRKGSGRLGALSLETLRLIRDQSPILNAIHAAREHQVRRLSRRFSGVPGDVGFRVEHYRYRDPDFETQPEIEVYKRRFETVLFKPSPRYCPTIGQAMVGLMEDLLTINRPAVEVLHSAIDPGRVVGFRPVDGALIWPTLEWVERWKVENPAWYVGVTNDPSTLTDADVLDVASAAMDYELHGSEYCLVREGTLEAVYRPGRLIVAPVYNRTDVLAVGYPPSTVEKAVAAAVAFLNAWTYNDSFFTKGMLAEFALGLSGNIHPDDLDAIRDMFREATQGVRRAWETPLIPLPDQGTLTKIDLKAPNKDMMYEVWLSLLIALTTAVYRMDPTEVNAKPWDSGGGPKLSEAGRGDEIALAKEEGLQSDVEHLALSILTPLAQRCHPDLIVVAEYGGDAPSVQAEIHAKRASVHVTRNEIRLLDGLTPLGFWVPPKKLDGLSDEDLKKYEDNPWNWPTDSGFASAKSQQAMMAQQAEQAAAGGPGGPEGQDEGVPDEQDDGFGQPDAGQDEDDGFGGPPPNRPFGKAVLHRYVVAPPRGRAR